ncbi:hypothetical protein [Aureimonas leprariae]|uniref:Uncharacterized protein n=1 Tax=Plantimonas leprariae TaxID=2615207 RepID=A0A7V7TX10_9HYPH|nr:hypothetical protein [Aureimonas leprariae]KAB0680185.1 hypothetical protein F6X38_08320 [Aureimonas leprariae]
MAFGDEPPENDNRTRDDVLDEIANLTLQSYQLAKGMDHHFLMYLIGMVLIEVGYETTGSHPEG